MSSQPVYVFAKWQVKEGLIEIVLPLLAELATKTREEKGNIFYKVHQSNSDANTIVLFEGYIDNAAIEAHRSSIHFQTLATGKIIPNLESREVTLASELIFA